MRIYWHEKKAQVTNLQIYTGRKIVNRPQADHSMCSWLITAYMKQTESMRIMDKALKIAYLNYISV